MLVEREGRGRGNARNVKERNKETKIDKERRKTKKVKRKETPQRIRSASVSNLFQML
jgi:hypothetical protein